MTPSPIKILHVVFSLEPGGMENGLVNVADALAREEFEVYVCCLEHGGGFVKRLPQPANVFELNKAPGFSPSAAYQLARVISRVKPDVVHSHNLGPLIYSALATRLGRSVPLLHGEHGQLPVAQRNARRLWQRKWLYHCCRQVHTVSQNLRQHLVELGLPADKITAIVNGVDTEHFQPGAKATAKAAQGLPVEAPVLGIVGRLCANKRHNLLFDAFARLAGREPQARLLVVGGGGPDEAQVLRQARSNPAADRIHLLGMQPDVRPFYQAMDLLVAPSVYEGLSNVVLEAMSCGVPVLTHTACGNGEVVRDGVDGFVCELSTVEQLEGKLREVLADPRQLERMGGLARQNVVERFSLAAMVREYAAVYRRLTGRSRTGAPVAAAREN